MSTTEASVATLVTIGDCPCRQWQGESSFADATRNLPSQLPLPPSQLGAWPVSTPIHNQKVGGGWKIGVCFFDFVRLCAVAATLVAAITMGTTRETLPFRHRTFSYTPTSLISLLCCTSVDNFHYITSSTGRQWRLMVLLLQVLCHREWDRSDLLMSLPFSLAAMVRPHATQLRLILFIFTP
ncbi:hypothetical protein Cni_G20163 [Canna indica]|uniref:CASP-like protein n=1 Tax=Canna indica TaxID=4628 RepID=A0AAQ3QJ82_9LILI|nr:hypothetical protein Cni_G20163 [Canna indica]